MLLVHCVHDACCGGKRPAYRIVGLGSREGTCILVSTASDQHSAVGEQGGRVQVPLDGHFVRGRERTGRWIVNLGGASAVPANRSDVVRAARDQYSAVR